MDEFIKELTNWLKAQKEKELQEAEDCSCFDEISCSEAFRWCANSYDDVLDKVKELKKRYL